MEDWPIVRSPSRTNVSRPKSALSMKLIEKSNKKRKQKTAQGKEMHFLVKTRKETESEVFKKKNRVNQLQKEKKRQKESIEKQKKTSNRLSTVRSKHSDFQNYINTRKKELRQEHLHRKEQIKKEREHNQMKLSNALNSNLKSKQINRNAVKAKSIENSNILTRHLFLVNQYNRQRAKSISDHQRKVKNDRENRFKLITDSSNNNYVSRMENEIVTTINAKKELRDLSCEEDRLAKSIVNSSRLGMYSRQGSPQDFMSTRQLNINFNLNQDT